MLFVIKIPADVFCKILNDIRNTIAGILFQQTIHFIADKTTRFHHAWNVLLAHPAQPKVMHVQINLNRNVVHYHPARIMDFAQHFLR